MNILNLSTACKQCLTQRTQISSVINDINRINTAFLDPFVAAAHHPLPVCTSIIAVNPKTTTTLVIIYFVIYIPGTFFLFGLDAKILSTPLLLPLASLCLAFSCCLACFRVYIPCC